MRTYIAGKMRGLPLYNFPAFDKAKEHLASLGYTPISPADIDRQMGFDPSTLPADHDWSTIPEALDLKAVVRRDIEAILTCKAIYMLPGWEMSKGARAELAVAQWLGLEVIYGR